MLILGTFLVAAFFGLVVSRLPRQLLFRYCASFRARHGEGVQLGVVVLVTILVLMVLATAVMPGHAFMELVNAAAVTVLALALLADLYFFTRR